MMELVAGRTLAERVAGGPLTERELTLLAGDVSAALEEAHERGVVHRDLKPANVIITPKGRAKVLDFGLARLSATAVDAAQTASQTGSAMAGTLPYMAPEQVRGDPVDARTDIYALGVVLFEMATGKRPFERGSYLLLAREAAEELRGVVRPAAAQVTAHAGTSSSEAELAYQQGLHHFNRFNYQHRQEDFDLALAAYRRALQIDPQMAQAAAEIGWLYEFKLESGAPVGDVLPEMERWGRRAIQIDSNNSRAWALLAFAEQLSPNQDFGQMMISGLRAAVTGPRDAFALNALGLSMWGAASELALAAMQEAARIDPLYLYPPLNAAELLAYLARPAEALERVEAVLRIEPGMPLALARKALVLLEMGRIADAAAVLGRLRTFVSEGRIEPLIVSMIEDGVALGSGGPQEKARALDRLVRVNLDAGFYSEYPPVYVWLITNDRVDDALATLEARAREGRVPYDFLRLRPEFNAVTRDPRFVRILELSRRHFDAMLASFERARGRGEFPGFLERPLTDLQRKLEMPSAGALSP